MASGKKIGLPLSSIGNNNTVPSIDQISPELAALIVKKFVLPMFESEDKKQLTSKYNKMKGVSTANTKMGYGKFAKQNDARNSNSVYGELKLSEKLVAELDVIRDHVDSLNEQLEEALYNHESAVAETKQLNHKYQAIQKVVEA